MHPPLTGISDLHRPIFHRLQRCYSREVIPEHAEVANAVGAIISRIVETVEIDAHPVYNVTGIDRYEVRSSAGTAPSIVRNPLYNTQ